MNDVSIKNKKVTEYWKEFYLTDDKLCSLCGNYGVINTIGVASPNGNYVGRKNFCICPNGQDLRTTYINKSKDRKIMP